MAVIFIKWFSDAKYYLSKGLQRAEREKKHEQSEMLWSTARVMEVSGLICDQVLLCFVTIFVTSVTRLQ